MRRFTLALALAASAGTFAMVQSGHAEDRHDRDREVRREERKEEAGWVKLGERKVEFRNERDTIEVGRSEGKFTRLRLRVVDGDLELYKMKVIFEHGEPFEPDLRQHFSEGERTKDIDLPGDARTVKRVEFSYKSEHHSPAVIELIGKEAR